MLPKTKTLLVLFLVAVGFVAVLLLRFPKHVLQGKIFGQRIKRYSSLTRKLKMLLRARLQGTKLVTSQTCSHAWEKKYIQLHKEIIQLKRSPNYLVFDCGGVNYGCGGYGNRIGAISSIFLLAVLTNRAFLINWKSNVTILDYLQPKNIDWDFNKVNLQGLSKRHHMWGKGLHKNLPVDVLRFKGKDKKGFTKWFRQTNLTKFFSYQVEAITSHWYFTTAMIRENKFFEERSRSIAPIPRGHRYSFIGCAYNFLFKKTPRFENLLKKARQYLNWKDTVLRIGIHFRAGDNSFKDIKTGSSIFVRLEKYFDCAKRLEKRLKKAVSSVNTSVMKWFLATDNMEVKDYAMKNYPDKVVSLGIRAEHISRKEPSRAGLEGVLMDNVLLSECDILILSYSTFSNVALGLGFHSKSVNSIGDQCIY